MRIHIIPVLDDEFMIATTTIRRLYHFYNIPVILFQVGYGIQMLGYIICRIRNIALFICFVVVLICFVEWWMASTIVIVDTIRFIRIIRS